MGNVVVAPGYLPGGSVEFPSGLNALVQIPISFKLLFFFFYDVHFLLVTHCFLKYVGLPDLANKNIGCPNKF